MQSTADVYQTLNVLLERLFHAAVCGNGKYSESLSPTTLTWSIDPQYIDTFLLTYCRFIRPRDLLWAIFKELEVLALSFPSTNAQAFAFLRSMRQSE